MKRLHLGGPRRATESETADVENPPWRIVHTDDKHEARLSAIRDMLSHIQFSGKRKELCRPDCGIVYPYTPDAAVFS